MPVADIIGSRPGPTLLITAGLDGDEYPPIAAAFEAAQRFKDGDFAGRLIILPIVNMVGFDAGTSKNPIDGKYPKYCIPGSLIGTSSQRLMRRVVQTYARHAALWLDLHSAARDETVIPCLWNAVTGVPDVDMRGEAFIRTSGVVAAVREQGDYASRTLASYGCTYVLAESEDEQQHSIYIERAMQTLGMIPGTATQSYPRMFRKTRPMRSLEEEIAPNEVVLWKRTAPPEHASDKLGEIAYEQLT